MANAHDLFMMLPPRTYYTHIGERGLVHSCKVAQGEGGGGTQRLAIARAEL